VAYTTAKCWTYLQDKSADQVNKTSMEYDKISNASDASMEDGYEADDQLPQIVYRASRWTRWAAVGCGILVLVEAIALISVVSSTRSADPALRLWCLYYLFFIGKFLC
jgi:hypothetical protein